MRIYVHVVLLRKTFDKVHEFSKFLSYVTRVPNFLNLKTFADFSAEENVNQSVLKSKTIICCDC